MKDELNGALYQTQLAQQQLQEQNRLIEDIRDSLQDLLGSMIKLYQANNELREMMNPELTVSKDLVR